LGNGPSRGALAKEMSEKFYMKQYQAHKMAEKVFESLKSLMMKEGKVIIHDFGSLTAYKGKRRKGPDTLKVRFRPSAKFLEGLKAGAKNTCFWGKELDGVLRRVKDKERTNI